MDLNRTYTHIHNYKLGMEDGFETVSKVTKKEEEMIKKNQVVCFLSKSKMCSKIYRVAYIEKLGVKYWITSNNNTYETWGRIIREEELEVCKFAPMKIRGFKYVQSIPSVDSKAWFLIRDSLRMNGFHIEERVTNNIRFLDVYSKKNKVVCPICNNENLYEDEICSNCHDN